MKRLAAIFLFLLLISNAFFAFAQKTGSITGRIIDSDNLALPYANVQVESTTKGGITDLNGYFTILGLEPGVYELSVSYIGFLTKKQTVEVTEGKTLSVDFIMQSGVELQEIIVEGSMKGQVKALNSQRNSSNIVNVISSDQIGRFPDANIGDALKRIPGINVQYDQGEARFGNIRGTSPQLNSVTINGERVPSAEAEIRSVQLDLVPSEMVQTIEVSKAVTPDMDADAIGGSINLVTRSNPYSRRLSLSLGSGYNVLAGKPQYQGSLVYGNRFFNKKVGVVLGASYHNHQLGSDNIESEWDYEDENNKNSTAFSGEFQVRQYYIQRIRQSYSASIDYKLSNNHKIFVTGIYNWRNDWENRYRLIYTDIENDGTNWLTQIRRETKAGSEDNKFARLEDQRMMNMSFGGDHLFGKIRVEWSGSYAKASEERPHERYMSYRLKDVIINPDFTNTEKPKITVVSPASASDFTSDYEFRELTEQYQYTDDIDKNFKLNFKIPLSNGNFASKLKVGFKYKGKDKERDNWFNEYEPVDEATFNPTTLANLKNMSKSNFLAGDYKTGNHIDEEFVGNIDLTNTGLLDVEAVKAEEAGDFNATENVFAGYGMLTQNFGKNLEAVLGLRVEQTKIEYQGYQYFENTDVLSQSPKMKSDYTNILPGLHVNYKLRKNSVVRFAWTNTIARPNYFDLVPYREVSEDNEIAIGNPGLKPTKSMNFDISIENYFKTIGIVSVGAFNKNITDFIVNQTKNDFEFEGHVWDTYNQPLNAGDATIYGIEFAFQRQLDFLPKALRGLGIYTNYTYNFSEVSKSNIADRNDLSLPGSPKHTLNISLSYDYKNFSSRVSFNYTSDFLDEIGTEAFYDRHYDKVTYLDFNASYRFAKNYTVYFEANNLLNQPLRYYQGVSSRTMQEEYYNYRLQFGLKLDLL
jgi:TonB-dependent receptor